MILSKSTKRKCRGIKRKMVKSARTAKKAHTR